MITQAELRRVLCYNPFSGNFMWRVSMSSRAEIGNISGTTAWFGPNRRPYRFIRIHGRRYRAHRLVFLYIRGRWPREIDHKDRDGLNNRWLNLRECTHSQNVANRGPTKNNKLGIKGVYYHTCGRYHARIRMSGKHISLGLFDTPGAAGRAYRRAAKKHFGEFASWQ